MLVGNNWRSRSWGDDPIYNNSCFKKKGRDMYLEMDFLDFYGGSYSRHGIIL